MCRLPPTSGCGGDTCTCGSSMPSLRSWSRKTWTAPAPCWPRPARWSPTPTSPLPSSGSTPPSSSCGRAGWTAAASFSERPSAAARRTSCSKSTCSSSFSWATWRAAGSCTESTWNGPRPTAPPGPRLPSWRRRLVRRSERGGSTSSRWHSRRSTCQKLCGRRTLTLRWACRIGRVSARSIAGCSPRPSTSRSGCPSRRQSARLPKRPPPPTPPTWPPTTPRPAWRRRRRSCRRRRRSSGRRGRRRSGCSCWRRGVTLWPPGAPPRTSWTRSKP
mmetsp:Transcript_26780/g.86453  ORF Transcript_26780/g.86453 Transcript_26780/m.86453 type:complete len:274 (+) Transcript_26780:1120-1941(+)